MNESKTIQIDGEQIIIDPKNLYFTRDNLSQYIEREAGWIDYFGEKLAMAEKELAEADEKYETISAAKFIHYNDIGGTVKLIDARTKTDPDVQIAKQAVVANNGITITHNIN